MKVLKIIWILLAIGALSQIFNVAVFSLIALQLIGLWFCIWRRQYWLGLIWWLNCYLAVLAPIVSIAALAQVTVFHPLYALFAPSGIETDLVRTFNILDLTLYWYFVIFVAPMVACAVAYLLVIRNKTGSQQRTAISRFLVVNVAFIVLIAIGNSVVALMQPKVIPYCSSQSFSLAINEQNNECAPSPVFDTTGGLCTAMTLPKGWQTYDSKKVSDLLPNSRPVPTETYIAYGTKSCEIQADVGNYYVRICNDTKSFYAGPCAGSYIHAYPDNPWKDCCEGLGLSYRDRYINPPSLQRAQRLERIERAVNGWSYGAILLLIAGSILMYFLPTKGIAFAKHND